MQLTEILTCMPRSHAWWHCYEYGEDSSIWYQAIDIEELISQLVGLSKMSQRPTTRMWLVELRPRSWSSSELSMKLLIISRPPSSFAEKKLLLRSDSRFDSRYKSAGGAHTRESKPNKNILWLFTRLRVGTVGKWELGRKIRVMGRTTGGLGSWGTCPYECRRFEDHVLG